MPPTTLTVSFGRHRVFSYTPFKGAYSKFINPHQSRSSGLFSRIDTDSTLPCKNMHKSIHNPTRGLATAVHSSSAVSSEDFKFFSDLLNYTEPKTQTKAVHGGSVSSDQTPLVTLPGPFKRALEALRQKDTRRLLIYLQQITSMEEAELHAAVSSLPRTTFTELLRALDPFVVARDADPTNQTHISAGAYQMLNLSATIDIWGVRNLYSQLLRHMLVLLSALKASGGVLQLEEYIYLVRCAGAASDPTGVKWVWNEMVRTQTTSWRQSAIYAEFVSARFLTNPLYTGYDKTRRMVTSRSLHNSKFLLHWAQIRKMDYLRYRTRRKKLFFGLNKDAKHAEDLIRMMRKDNAAMRLYIWIHSRGTYMTESLACALMIAFGRAGSLRFISANILDRHFGIRIGKIVHNMATDINQGPNRVRPTALLMEAIVETYGSNAEIPLALQLVLHLSKTFRIHIPAYIWKDLMEWAYIMGSVPLSGGWKIAKMFSKVPNTQIVEFIWDMMVSEPYYVQPSFEHYNILIRNLIARNQFSRFMPYMREAIDLYHIQCREYEDAVIEYSQMINDNGVRLSETVHRYQRARFKKATMRYSIQTWCRQFLTNVQAFNPTNPLVTVAVPNFIDEFKTFIPNPAFYRTSDGYVSLFDPIREPQRLVPVESIPITIHVKSKIGEVLHLTTKTTKYATRSRQTLAGRKPISRFTLETLLTTTSRAGPPKSWDKTAIKEAVEESEESMAEIESSESSESNETDEIDEIDETDETGEPGESRGEFPEPIEVDTYDDDEDFF
ncbi:hypothetical protein F4813DRAFT_370271 [Daldinia decipiens]|uniref:uncharacterized protein n=1 Tax=Daldinia decipiens TaxID=326647 RepID=UPI0020C23DE7|nr:uncharacterized protein F4813DRAFT_370271 [Daldinia decipiens]KAI1654545.1 hypothetical protein F4813DRAFT_370271 [Daldinia decipiens]